MLKSEDSGPEYAIVWELEDQSKLAAMESGWIGNHENWHRITGGLVNIQGGITGTRTQLNDMEY